MRNVLMALAGGIVVGGLVVWGISRHAETPTAAPDDARALAAGSEPQTLQLSTEQQAKAGIVVASLETRELPREVKGYGQVVDPQPLLDLLTELKSADASREASAKEYARVQALHANDQNASARAVEAAAAAMKRDQIQVEAARNKLIHAWGASLTTRADLPKIAQALSTLDAVLIRVDLPLDESLSTPPASARVLSPTDPK
ncbi:MAG TPA: hypothetical protein VJT80_20100, partial [Steroidobacteraceae bacterium]|nr:hypothetical protein [Steroidobacteraceae bacterium]